MADDGVREIHGASPMAGAAKEPFTLRETDEKIVVFQGFVERMSFTPASARFFARKLYRLARRIEQRAATPNQGI